MEFHLKQATYQELKGQQHLEADRNLLSQIRPTSKVLKGLRNPDVKQLQEKILWELLDVATIDQICKNRQNEAKKTLFGSVDNGSGTLDPDTPPDPDEKKKSSGGSGKAKGEKESTSKRDRVPKH